MLSVLRDADLYLTASTTASAAGAGSVKFQPTVLGTSWTVQLVTATAGVGVTIKVLRNGVTVIDSTFNDPRPEVTSDSTYELHQGEYITVTWTGAAAGAALTAALTGILHTS